MSCIDHRALEQLQELIGGDKEAFLELVNTFLSEGKDIVADMHNSMAGRDVELLRRSAHSLKSSAQDFGSAKLSELCGALEYGCKAGWPEQVDSHIKLISTEFETVSNELVEYGT